MDLYIHWQMRNTIFICIAFIFGVFPKGESIGIGEANVNIEVMNCKEGYVGLVIDITFHIIGSNVW